MSRFQQSIDLSLCRADVHGVCVTAILDLRWQIASETEGRIACQEAVDAIAQSISPARIVLSLHGSPGGPTRVMVNGAAFGSGSEQRTHVRHRVELLARTIEEAAAGLAAALAGRTVAWFGSDWSSIDRARRRAFLAGKVWPGVGTAPAIGAVRPSPPTPKPVVLIEVGEDR